MRTFWNVTFIWMPFFLLGVLAWRTHTSEDGIALLLIAAILTAVYGVYTNTLKHKLYSYIWQSATLVPLAFLRCVETSDIAFVYVMVFLLIRVLLIPWLMSLATVRRNSIADTSEPVGSQPGQWLRAQWDSQSKRYHDAQRYWLIYGETRLGSALSVAVSALFIGLSYLIVAVRVQVPAFSTGTTAGSTVISDIVAPTALGAAISLLLVGLFAMINEKDLPSQIVGLLIMENGLFLAAVMFITMASFLTSFWISMVTFFFITFAIFAKFVPDMHFISRSEQIGQQTLLSECIEPEGGDL